MSYKKAQERCVDRVDWRRCVAQCVFDMEEPKIKDQVKSAGAKIRQPINESTISELFYVKHIRTGLDVAVALGFCVGS